MSGLFNDAVITDNV